MANKIEIINKALRLLKQERINSIDDNTEAAAIARDMYELSRGTLCAMVDWHCLRRRVKLVKDNNPPSFGFDYSYTLPSDCERVIGVQYKDEGFYVTPEHAILPDAYNLGLTYTIESNKLLTNEEEVNLLYIYKEEDTSKYDALFVNSLSYLLAIEMAPSLLAETTYTQLLDSKYEYFLRMAKARNALNTSPPAESSPFVVARY